MSVFGLLNVHKPSGPTSHDIVAAVRRGTDVKKVGHAGTLDPMASGVLVLCLGPATRLSEYVMESRKTYRARVRFGVETDTYDAEGTVIAENDRPVTQEAVEGALAAFRGPIEQVPPMYSAIKQGGKKLYELARAGQEVERPARSVTIYQIELLAWAPPDAVLDVMCSPGTYIRSLAHDLGAAVGIGAHLAALERTTSGPFTAVNAVEWAELQAAMDADTWRDALLPPDMALMDAPAVYLSPEDAGHVRHGRLIAATPDIHAAALARAYDPDGQFFAVLERREQHWKPGKVFV